MLAKALGSIRGTGNGQLGDACALVILSYRSIETDKVVVIQYIVSAV